MTHLLAVTSMVLYVLAAALMIFQLWRPSRAGRSVRVAQLSFYSALALHTVTLGLVLNDSRYVLLENGADYFLIASWGLAAAFAALQRRLNYPIVGAFLIPAIVLFMGSSSYLLHQEATSLLPTDSSQAKEGILMSLLHGVPALVAVVSLAMALVVSAVFLIVEGRLKARKAGALSISGPNLQLLDMLNRQLIQVGFVAISFVVLSGSLWAVSRQQPIFSADTSVISGLVTWMLLAFILHVRLVLKWSPKQVSRLTVLVTASFFVTAFAVMAWAGRFTHAELFS
jgi:ABC-type transport system involved in cytochrome c biogenesis permease subunit